MTITITYNSYIYTITLTSSGEITEVLRQHTPHEVPYNVELTSLPERLIYKLQQLTS